MFEKEGGMAMEIQGTMTLEEKLHILADAAKYDVACTSSGSKRSGAPGSIGSACEAGICHSFAADGRCISLLKILLTNHCVFDCRYCVNRSSNDVPRAAFTPEEICTLTMEFYKRNYIEGLFLSSGVVKSPSYTMGLLYETLYLLRFKYRFRGYIHVKAIPGADSGVLERIGYLADRMSVNLELPTSEALSRLAPGKTRKTILGPMRLIQRGTQSNTNGAALGAYQATRLQLGSRAVPDRLGIRDGSIGSGFLAGGSFLKERSWLQGGRLADYVPAGQSTQMIVGAAGESDYEVLAVSEALYRNYDLKRVFYSGFLNTTGDSLLPNTPDGPPLLREHRLYQADWLLRYYGFRADELLSESRPNFNPYLDPKCDWAVRHLEQFPVDVETASHEQLLRVPGIGVKSARRILRARRNTRLDYDCLKRLGVVLKRAHYFILCGGRQMLPSRIDEGFITAGLMAADQRANWRIGHADTGRQLSLFDDFGLRIS